LIDTEEGHLLIENFVNIFFVTSLSVSLHNLLDFYIYIYTGNLQLLNNVIIIKIKVKLHQTQVNNSFISTTYTQYRVKGYKQTKNGSNTCTNNNYHTQTNKTAVSQYNKCNQVPPILSSKDRLIKEPKDFTCCEEVGLRILVDIGYSV
jgi:hypothetical protein